MDLCGDRREEVVMVMDMDKFERSRVEFVPQSSYKTLPLMIERGYVSLT